MKYRIFISALIGTVLLVAGCTGETPSGPASQASHPSNLPKVATGHSFELLTPNSARASNGASIVLSGAGSFNTGAKTIHGGGFFTRFDPKGNLVARGNWEPTGFISFRAFGGPNPGIQGGELTTGANLFPAGGGGPTQSTLVITCLVFAGPIHGLFEGIVLGSFTQSTGGQTLFNLHVGTGT